MDQYEWHTKIILKRFGLLFILMLLEQCIFFLDPASSLSKALPASAQTLLHKHISFVVEGSFAPILKICLTIIIMVLLISYLQSIVRKQDEHLVIDTMSPIRSFAKEDRPKIPTVGIVALAFLAEFVVNVVANLVRTLTTPHQTISANQSTLNALAPSVTSALWLIILGAILIPIFEELIFRRLLIDYVGPESYHKQFIVLSVILFTAGHMLSTTNFIADAIAYGGSGIILTFLYVKFHNIRYGIYTHIILNTLAFSPLIKQIYDYVLFNKDSVIAQLLSGQFHGHIF